MIFTERRVLHDLASLRCLIASSACVRALARSIRTIPMVGSYSSKNMCCTNCIVKQDLPTPPSPTTAAFTTADMAAARPDGTRCCDNEASNTQPRASLHRFNCSMFVVCLLLRCLLGVSACQQESGRLNWKRDGRRSSR